MKWNLDDIYRTYYIYIYAAVESGPIIVAYRAITSSWFIDNLIPWLAEAVLITGIIHSKCVSFALESIIDISRLHR